MIAVPATTSVTSGIASPSVSIDPASIALPSTRQVDVTRFVVEAFARL